MKAFVTVEGGSAAVQEVPKPVPSKGEILVRVHYAAQNPTDWKSVPYRPAGRIAGCDFAGTVADPNGSKWREGQRVAGSAVSMAGSMSSNSAITAGTMAGRLLTSAL